MTQMLKVAPADLADLADLVAVVRDFITHEVLPQVGALDAAKPGVFAKVWQQLARIGLDRALLGDQAGGAGLDVGDFLCVLEELAVGDAGTALAVLLNNAAVVSLPVEVASALPGGVRWTLALASSAGESVGESLQLARDGRSVRVSGRLPAVFGAVDADGVAVAIRMPHPVVFAVPSGTPGLTVQPDSAQLGLRAARLADLVFSDVRLPAAPGLDADAMESRVRSLVRCGVAAICRGIARRAREIALTYAHNRIQGGVRIVQHGAVADMLAGMAVRMHSLGAVALGAAVGDPAAALAHKVAASDAAMGTALDAVQVMGGIGYMTDTGVEKLMRDAKYCQLYPESNWVARDELIRLDGRAAQRFEVAANA